MNATTQERGGNRAGRRVTEVSDRNRNGRKGYRRFARVEWRGGTKIRFHMSCGHRYTKDMAKTYKKGHPGNRAYANHDGSPAEGFFQMLNYWFGRRPGKKKIEVGDIGNHSTYTRCARCLRLKEAGKPYVNERLGKIRWSDEPGVWHPPYTLPPRKVESVREQSRD